MISGTSTGTVALGADSSNNLNFTDLPNLSLGAVGDYTYSGTITPGRTAICSAAAAISAVTSCSSVTGSLLTGATR